MYSELDFFPFFFSKFLQERIFFLYVHKYLCITVFALCRQLTLWIWNTFPCIVPSIVKFVQFFLSDVSVPTDSEGINVEDLDKRLTELREKTGFVPSESQPFMSMLYLVPTFNNPTGRCQSPGEWEILLYMLILVSFHWKYSWKVSFEFIYPGDLSHQCWGHNRPKHKDAKPFEKHLNPVMFVFIW